MQTRRAHGHRRQLCERVLLGVVALAVTTAGGCQKKGGAAAAPPVAVELERVRTTDVTRPLVLFGQTEPMTDAVLSFQQSGLVERVPVTEGDYVRRGDLLAALDKESLQLNVSLSRARLAQASVTYRKFRKGFRKETIQQQYAAYKRAQALYDKARADWDSGQKLWRSKTISRTQYLGFQTSYRSSKASLEQARQAYKMHLKGYQTEDVQAAGVQASQASTQLKMARKQLRDTELHAPFAGVVAAKHIEMGELVSAARQAFRLMDIRMLEIKIGVPERVIDSVQLGQQAFISVGQDEQPDRRQLIIGKITRKGVALDRTTMTYPVSIRISNPVVGGTKTRPRYRMLPGKVVRVLLFSRQRKQGMTVPLSAVLHDGQETFVYVSADKRAKKVPVTPGLTHRNRIEIQGLDEGTEVVVKGQHRLSPGRRLWIVRTRGGETLPGPLGKQLLGRPRPSPRTAPAPRRRPPARPTSRSSAKPATR